MPIVQSDVITAREKILLDADRDENERNRQYQLNLKKTEVEAKKLELQLRQQDRIRFERHQQKMATTELEIRRYEASWTNILRLPITIVKLPVYVLFGIAYIISILTKQELNDKFWSFIDK